MFIFSVHKLNIRCWQAPPTDSISSIQSPVVGFQCNSNQSVVSSLHVFLILITGELLWMSSMHAMTGVKMYFWTSAWQYNNNHCWALTDYIYWQYHTNCYTVLYHIGYRSFSLSHFLCPALILEAINKLAI